jgi:hypothetical protein
VSTPFTFCVFMRKASKNYFKKNLPFAIVYVIDIQIFICSPKIRGVAETSLARFLLLFDYYSQPAIYMKSIKSMALLAALASGYALSASAATITLSPYGDIDLFKCIEAHAVPDSGATVMLLGVALAGLALMRRYLRR